MTIIPTPWVMALVFVVFLILVYGLNRILYKPLLSFMEAREASIKKDGEGIDCNNSEIIKLHKEAEDIIQAAKIEANAIKSKAKENAKISSEARIAQKRDELNLKYREFVENLEGEKEQLKTSLLTQIPLFKEELKIKLGKLL
ncbi:MULTISPECIES: F0F1 ATP synthase subunit B family protein [Helicobacter]|uniref:F0F1 ATP synthase subunit B n=1 Tax=Helicobacter ibis TaxID=2962633 RepID=A0ABT4VEK7_9HELI|nr:MULTISPECIES: F0F1 ATP synthase subunit B' [Helicobacter]MDA3967318.1 F0F1 ATP synthase subunit B' [Helicobacter sp. WB40]MDA3968613.1 F0F1 ATP synthase subunit B' [Helicobacter ibis]